MKRWTIRVAALFAAYTVGHLVGFARGEHSAIDNMPLIVFNRKDRAQ